MDMIKRIFQYKSVNLEKLTAYGFSKKSDIYSYHAALSDSGFDIAVYVTEHGEVTASVMDTTLNEPYTLHLVDGAVGSFVGSVRLEYEQILTEIARGCFDPEIFQNRQTKEVIAYVKEKYKDELEYLWKKSPNNAIVRRKDKGKWYAAILTVSRRKLGFDSDEIAEVLDLRMKPEEVEKSVDGQIILPGYHMNKKHWITICLDGRVSLEKICALIDESYKLAVR